MEKDEYTAVQQYLSDIGFYKSLIGYEDKDFEDLSSRMDSMRRPDFPPYKSKKRDNLVKFIRERILEKLNRSTIIKSKMNKDNLTLRDYDIIINLNSGGGRIYRIEKDFSNFFYFSENKLVKSWTTNLERTISSNAFKAGKIWPLRSLSNFLSYEKGLIDFLDGNTTFFHLIDDGGPKRHLIYCFIKTHFSKRDIDDAFNAYFSYEKSPRKIRCAEEIYNVLKHG